MDHRIRVDALSSAIVVAIAIVVSMVTSVAMASRAYTSRAKSAAAAAQEITVKGSARQRVRSDLAVWRIGVRAEGATLEEAYASVERSVERVLRLLSERGFDSAEIAVSAIDTSTHYERDAKGQETRKVAGYSLERGVRVRTENVDRVAGAAGDVTTLLKEGVQVVSGRPEYYFSKAADMKVQIVGDASADARARAEEMIARSGGRLGGVKRAQMGVLQITEPDSTEVASYGIYDTSTIDKDVSVVATLTFGVEAP